MTDGTLRWRADVTPEMLEGFADRLAAHAAAVAQGKGWLTWPAVQRAIRALFAETPEPPTEVAGHCGLCGEAILYGQLDHSCRGAAPPGEQAERTGTTYRCSVCGLEGEWHAATSDCVKGLRAALAQEREARQRVEAAVRWALGEGDSDFSDYTPADWKPRYWWRTELRRRALAQQEGDRGETP